MTDTPPLDLPGIAARCKAATEGPWIRYGVRHKMGDESCIAVGPDGKLGPLAFLPIGSQQRDKYHAEAMRDADFIAHARTDVPALLSAIDGLRSLCAEQAADGGLWFIPQTAAEAYLMQELRKLHAAIEGRSPEECALRTLAAGKPSEGGE